MNELVALHCTAVLFDMDGTLVDSTAVVERAWGGWAARHGLTLEAVLTYSHGRPTGATLEHFFPGRDLTKELEELEDYEATHLDGIRAVPGAMEAVEAVQHQPWAVVTSAPRALAEARISAAGLAIPKVLVPVDEIRRGKPDPEGFLRASALLGVAPHQCLVFEDTRPGIDAGLNAGMQVVALLTTMPAERLDHPLLIRDFRDVTIRPGSGGLQIEFRNQASRA